MKLYKPQKIFVEKIAASFPFAQEILKRLPDVPVEEVEDSKVFISSFAKRENAIGEGKKYLLLAFDKGRAFRPFSESEQYVSCDYHTLHVIEGCDLECSYCILQSYLTNHLLTIYVNLEQMLEELQNTLNQNPSKYYRIGIGQLADALSLDHITGLSKRLVPFMARQNNAMLELKTKSVNIENLLSLNPDHKTLVSWSLNSKRIQQAEEHKCASISERIQAAKTISSKSSYRVGFHIDPIIDYEGWERDYKEVIDELFSNIPTERISWISLGCLRMMNNLKSIMQERFPKSSLPHAEWIRGMDGKIRYFKPRRIEIYKTIVEMIKKHSPTTTLYLSMESSEVWRHVLGFEANKESVCNLLDSAVKNPLTLNS